MQSTLWVWAPGPRIVPVSLVFIIVTLHWVGLQSQSLQGKSSQLASWQGSFPEPLSWK